MRDRQKNEDKNIGRYVSRKTLAQEFNVSPRTISRWAANGYIHQFFVGGRFFYDRSTLETDLKRFRTKMTIKKKEFVRKNR